MLMGFMIYHVSQGSNRSLVSALSKMKQLSKIKKLAQLESFEALHLTALYFPFELLGLTLLTTVLMNKESGRGSHVIALFQEPGI